MIIACYLKKSDEFKRNCFAITHAFSTVALCHPINKKIQLKSCLTSHTYPPLKKRLPETNNAGLEITSFYDSTINTQFQKILEKGQVKFLQIISGASNYL